MCYCRGARTSVVCQAMVRIMAYLLGTIHAGLLLGGEAKGDYSPSYARISSPPWNLKVVSFVLRLSPCPNKKRMGRVRVEGRAWEIG